MSEQLPARAAHLTNRALLDERVNTLTASVLHTFNAQPAEAAQMILQASDHKVALAALKKISEKWQDDEKHMAQNHMHDEQERVFWNTCIIYCDRYLSHEGVVVADTVDAKKKREINKKIDFAYNILQATPDAYFLDKCLVLFTSEIAYGNPANAAKAFFEISIFENMHQSAKSVLMFRSSAYKEGITSSSNSGIYLFDILDDRILAMMETATGNAKDDLLLRHEEFLRNLSRISTAYLTKNPTPATSDEKDLAKHELMKYVWDETEVYRRKRSSKYIH